VPTGWVVEVFDQTESVTARHTVTVSSFELRKAIPVDRLTVAFPPGEQVVVVDTQEMQTFRVQPDGTLVADGPVIAVPTFTTSAAAESEPDSAPPEADRPSLAQTVVVVGVAVSAFVVFAVVVRRLGRLPKEPAPEN
jgi:hypothetical protein